MHICCAKLSRRLFRQRARSAPSIASPLRRPAVRCCRCRCFCFCGSFWAGLRLESLDCAIPCRTHHKLPWIVRIIPPGLAGSDQADLALEILDWNSHACARAARNLHATNLPVQVRLFSLNFQNSEFRICIPLYIFIFSQCSETCYFQVPHILMHVSENRPKIQ